MLQLLNPFLVYIDLKDILVCKIYKKASFFIITYYLSLVLVETASFPAKMILNSKAPFKAFF